MTSLFASQPISQWIPSSGGYWVLSFLLQETLSVFNYSGYQQHATQRLQKRRIKLSFSGRQSKDSRRITIIKPTTSYKCSYCFQPLKQWLHLKIKLVKVLLNWPQVNFPYLSTIFAYAVIFVKANCWILSNGFYFQMEKKKINCHVFTWRCCFAENGKEINRNVKRYWCRHCFRSLIKTYCFLPLRTEAVALAARRML